MLFFPAYVGGPLVSIFGNAFSPLRARARDFGLAFASAILVHLGLVFYLCATGDPPGKGTFFIFGIAALFTYVLALLSIPRVRKALPVFLWPPIRAVATNYIAIAFILDFAKSPKGDFRAAIEYLPFAAFAIGGLILNLVAQARALTRFA